MAAPYNYVSQRVPPASSSPTVRHLFTLAQTHHVKLSDIADYLRMTRPAIANWKRGHSTPSILTVEEIADFLGYEIVIQRKRD